jgi:phosphate transport system substrate-binding protein
MGLFDSVKRAAIVSALVVTAITQLAPLSVGAADTVTLTGAGSTFDAPLFTKAFSEYTKSVNPNVQVNYGGGGSGAGISQLTDKTIDFGATDGPMTDEQLTKAGGPSTVLHIPVTLGAVAVIYNISGLSAPLNLDGAAVAAIFQGTITKWNDDKIKALNPGVDLPSTDIAVVHRSDGSGTTNIFTTYLSSVSSDWKANPGAANAVSWPVGIGGKGSDGVAGQVKQLDGSIGYVELAYATQNSIPFASIQNSSGAFVAPSAAGATACAAALADQLPADFRTKIAGCTGSDAAIYPISGYSWIILYADQSDAAKGAALVNLVNWLIHDGQQYGADLSYAPLPSVVVDKATAALATVNSAGQPLLVATPAS